MPTRYNLNRFRKTYPATRRTPVFMGSDDVETGTVTLTAEDSVTYEFKKKYLNVPIVTATPADSNNVNVYIHSITLTEVVLATSDRITGDIHVQISTAD